MVINSLIVLLSLIPKGFYEPVYDIVTFLNITIYFSQFYQVW